MIATFFKCTDDPRKLDKTLVPVKQKNVEIYSVISVIAPVLSLVYDSDILSCNYVQINEWNMYYHIDNFNVDNARRLYVISTLDDIYTFRDELKNCCATAIRNEGVGINYVPDPSLPMMPASNYCVSQIIGQYWSQSVEEQPKHYILATK